MTQHGGERPEHRRPVRLSLVAAVAALSVMGALTVAMGASQTVRQSTTVAVADATTHRYTAASEPPVPSAAPTMKVPPFSGGWMGGGPFHGGGWPGS